LQEIQSNLIVKHGQAAAMSILKTPSDYIIKQRQKTVHRHAYKELNSINYVHFVCICLWRKEIQLDEHVTVWRSKYLSEPAS
jgi:hypothetical protein